MPRDGSSIYNQPFPDVSPDTTIESPVYNGFVADIATDLNAPRPIIAGGTGTASADNALTNLSAEKSLQVVTNYNSMVWMPGSFYSASSATGAPVAGHAFVGYVYLVDSNNIVIEARDQNDAAVPGRKYVREKKAGSWSVWKSDTLTMLGTNEGVSGETADMSFGLTGTAPNSAFVVNTESDGSGINAIEVSKAGNTIIRDTSGNSQIVLNKSAGFGGKTCEIYGQTNNLRRWVMSLANTATESGVDNIGSNFTLNRYDDSGALMDAPLSISRSTGNTTLGNTTLGNTVTGTLTPTVITATAKGHLLGSATGTAATAAVTEADANIFFYHSSSINWAGIGSDTSGNMWFRVGTSGTPKPAMYLRADRNCAILRGTDTNNNASAGEIGEYIESSRTAAGAVTMGVSGTMYEIISISLTAGDWDVYAIARFVTGTPSSTRVQANVSATSAAVMNFDVKGHMAMSVTTTSADPFAVSIPPTRFPLASTTTIYLNTGQIFGGGSPTGYGHLMARRMR